MSNRLRFSTALTFVLVPLVLLAISQVAALKQDVPITILQAPADSVAIFSSAGAILTSPKGGQFLYVNDTTGGVMEYAESNSTSLSTRSLGATSGPVAMSADGHIAYVDKDSLVALFDSNGQQVAKVATYPAISLGILSNGNLLVASRGVNGHFLHVYSQSGQLLRSFGELNSYYNIYAGGIPKGKIVVDSMDNIYYVFQYLPLIQKYSPTGELVFERKVTGKAVDIQQEVADRFSRIKSPKVAGGIHIINSATIDYMTGHLWLCLNGSSRTGVIYEYSAEGEKLHEYVLQVILSPDVRHRITGVKDIAVTSSNLYVIDTYNQILSFNVSGGQTLKSADTEMVLNESEPPCGEPQTLPSTCGFTCPGEGACTGTPPQRSATSSNGSGLDCKTALENSLNMTNKIVVGSNCQQITPGTPMHMRGGCSYSITLCSNGNNSNHSITIDCPDPPACGTGDEGGGGGGGCDFQVCDGGLGWDFAQCCCASSFSGQCSGTPVVIDILGDGFDLTDAVGGVNFDLKPDGIAERLSWTSAGSDDAWLALDRNGNGTIDNGAELFGNFTPQSAPPPGKSKNGFLALAEFDKPANGGNRDGQIDNRDSIFTSLRLWQDTNHNGISEPNELHSLSALGIAVLELDYKESRWRDRYGNQFRYRAKVKDAHGAQVGRWAWDVYLVVQ